MADVCIRVAMPGDAGQVLGVYAPYVERTAITFEYEVPTVSEFATRIEQALARYPFLLAELGDKTVGFAYLGPFGSRAAYAWAAETSIYVSESAQSRGVGRALYQALEGVAKAQGLTNLNACIARPVVPDEYLTDNSVEFHAHLGYRMVGEFYKCGYKFGRWYNMAWMEKHIAPHPTEPSPVTPFLELSPATLKACGVDVRKK